MKKPPFNTKRKNNKSSTQVSVPRSAQIYQELTLLSAKDGRGIAGDHTHAEILPLLPRIGAIARLIPFVEIKSHNRDRDTHLSLLLSALSMPRVQSTKNQTTQR